jgi:hypothetical protein
MTWRVYHVYAGSFILCWFIDTGSSFWFINGTPHKFQLILIYIFVSHNSINWFLRCLFIIKYMTANFFNNKNHLFQTAKSIRFLFYIISNYEDTIFTFKKHYCSNYKNLNIVKTQKHDRTDHSKEYHSWLGKINFNLHKSSWNIPGMPKSWVQT